MTGAYDGQDDEPGDYWPPELEQMERTLEKYHLDETFQAIEDEFSEIELHFSDAIMFPLSGDVIIGLHSKMSDLERIVDLHDQVADHGCSDAVVELEEVMDKFVQAIITLMGMDE